MQLKPRRNKNLGQRGLASQVADDEDEKIEAVNLHIREPDEIERGSRAAHKATLELVEEGSRSHE